MDGLLAEAAERGVVDGVADLAEPMPVAVIAELIGVPPADRRTFRALVGRDHVRRSGGARRGDARVRGLHRRARDARRATG